LIPIIESAEGLANIDVLARCSSVLRLAFGNLDFQADMGMARVQADAARSVRFGFGAKLCIHPLQVAAVHAAFAPTAAQIDWAQRVLQAETAAGGGAFTVDGLMVDPPVLKLARQCLAMTRR